jgi:hypothetical protein
MNSLLFTMTLCGLPACREPALSHRHRSGNHGLQRAHEQCTGKRRTNK